MTDTAHIHPRGTPAHPPFSHRRHAPGAMLHCPCCHLSLRQRHPQMTIDYCPRCIARAHELVPLLPAPPQSALAPATRTPTPAASLGAPATRIQQGRGRRGATPAPVPATAGASC
jgi:hypothetical protein